MRTAIHTAILVARAGCAQAGRRVRGGAVATALGLLLSLGGAGCSMSHGASVDADGDGYEADVDCDDSRADVYPGAPEPGFPDCCDTPAVDHDCDGMPVFCACNPIPDDLDGDGWSAIEDCNDGDPTIYPGAPEDPCDIGGPDRDCDGVPPGAICNPFPDDLDGDGWGAVDDCDDSDPNVYPGADEPVCPDGVDQDCNGEDGIPEAAIACPPVDADGDGWGHYHDCDDDEPRIHPGIVEDICPDGIDQNCDGIDGDPGIVCNGMADPEEPADFVPA